MHFSLVKQNTIIQKNTINFYFFFCFQIELFFLVWNGVEVNLLCFLSARSEFDKFEKKWSEFGVCLGLFGPVWIGFFCVFQMENEDF